MPWTIQSKREILRNERQYGPVYGVTRADEMILVAPEKHGYLPALELDNVDIKNVTKKVFRISRLSPFLC